MLTAHQLSKPASNIAIDDPAWLETLRAEADRVLGEDSTDEILDETLLAMLDQEWSPHRTAGELRDDVGHAVALIFKTRPPAAHADGKTREFAEESGSPHPFDVVGKARVKGKSPALKALRNKIKADHEALLSLKPTKQPASPVK